MAAPGPSVHPTEHADLREPVWQEAGRKVGLQVWKIVKSKVTECPHNEYGQFNTDSSYIILNTYKKEGCNDCLFAGCRKTSGAEKLLYDVHYWIGKKSSQIDGGAAAYMTVDLYILLGKVPGQHPAELEGEESDLFKSYDFKNTTSNTYVTVKHRRSCAQSCCKGSKLCTIL